MKADEALAITMRNLRLTGPSEETLKTVREIESEIATRSRRRSQRRRRMRSSSKTISV